MFSSKDDYLIVDSERRLDRKLNKLKELNQDIESILESFTSDKDSSISCISCDCLSTESRSLSTLSSSQSSSSPNSSIYSNHLSHHVTLDSRLEHLFDENCTIKHHIVNPHYVHINATKPPKIQRVNRKQVPQSNKAKMSFTVRAPIASFETKKVTSSLGNLIKKTISNSYTNLNTINDRNNPPKQTLKQFEIAKTSTKTLNRQSKINKSTLSTSSSSLSNKRSFSGSQMGLNFKTCGKYKPDNPIFLSSDSWAWERPKTKKNESKNKPRSSLNWKPSNRVRHLDNYMKSSESLTSLDGKLKETKDSKTIELEKNWRPAYRKPKHKDSDDFVKSATITSLKATTKEQLEAQKKLEELEHKWKPAFKSSNLTKERKISAETKRESSPVKLEHKKPKNKFEDLERKWKPSGSMKQSTYPSDSDSKKNFSKKRAASSGKKSSNLGDPYSSSTPITSEDPSKEKLLKLMKEKHKDEEKKETTKIWKPTTVIKSNESKSWLNDAMMNAQKELESFKKPLQKPKSKKLAMKKLIEKDSSKNDPELYDEIIKEDLNKVQNSNEKIADEDIDENEELESENSHQNVGVHKPMYDDDRYEEEQKTKIDESNIADINDNSNTEPHETPSIEKTEIKDEKVSEMFVKNIEEEEEIEDEDTEEKTQVEASLHNEENSETKIQNEVSSEIQTIEDDQDRLSMATNLRDLFNNIKREDPLEMHLPPLKESNHEEIEPTESKIETNTQEIDEENDDDSIFDDDKQVWKIASDEEE